MYCITIIKLYICPKPIKIKSMKQSFTIPDGCTTVTVEQIENKLIATFEAKYEPKDGDIFGSLNNQENCIGIYKEAGKLPKMSYFVCLSFGCIYQSDGSSCHLGYVGNSRLATESEKQQLLDALAKDGKKWNAELKLVEKLRWRAKYGEWYEYLNTMKGFPNMEEAMERGDDYDNGRYNSGNYFKICKSHTVADRINAIFAENL